MKVWNSTQTQMLNVISMCSRIVSCFYWVALTNENPSVFQMLSPGYSYDTAYVEFLNLEDAVHFMESNKVAHPQHSTKAVSPTRITGGGVERAFSEEGGGRDGAWEAVL